MAEDAQIDVKAYGIGFQSKFKPNMISLHTDFGQFKHVHTCKDSQRVLTLWNNPYVFFESSRGLKLNSLYLGHLLHLNNFFRNNVS